MLLGRFVIVFYVAACFAGKDNTHRKETTKDVKDPFVANRQAAEDSMKDEEEEEDDSEQKFQYNGELVIYGDDLTPAEDFEEVEEGYTIAIIKPNAVNEGKVDEILAEMKARGIQVLTQEERQLTLEEAKEFYSHLAGEEYFDDLTKFMASGPSHVLVLTKGQEDDSVIKDWREMLGPPTVEDAKEQAPESLRARYGKAGLMNALHGSDSKDTAARELAFFFPRMHAPTIQKKKKEIQRTLALIRPDAFANNRDAILERIKESGFQIALQKEVLLTKEQAEEFYKEHAGQPYYEELTNRMSSGPLLALGLAREDAVDNWREMLGPTDVEEAKTSAPSSLRAQFAVEDTPINQIHGSDSVEAAKKELNFFFPVEQTVAMIKPDGYGTKDAIIDKIHEAGFRIAARKETTITRDIAESFYADQKDKEYFESLVEHMTSGPTMFMVLSREGAVDGWRQEIGPADPSKAKEEAPDSLRAMFGSDILKNAVHGCSSAEEAQQKIETLFGPLEFNPDGGETIQEEKEEEAISGSPVPKAADVAPEYRQEEKAEGQGENDENPATAEGEDADKAEGEVDQKPSEPTEDSAEKDDGAGQAAQLEAQEQQEQEVEDTTKKESGDKTEPTAVETEETPAEQKEDTQAQETKAEELQAEEPKAEEQKSQEEVPKTEEQKEEGKSEEHEERKSEEQTEEGKSDEQKEGTVEADSTAEGKKEGEEEKTEGTQQKDDGDAAAKN